ncbi:hypothetical protein IMZ48_20670 [Candidatus Bathyarchaeota archaeon]|nr:hypothetical protein [Candidatus Bathyarchaeota archaeon]
MAISAVVASPPHAGTGRLYCIAAGLPPSRASRPPAIWSIPFPLPPQYIINKHMSYVAGAAARREAAWGRRPEFDIQCGPGQTGLRYRSVDADIQIPTL